jgi:hypothetical protein
MTNTAGNTACSVPVVLEGHLLDSLTLAKVIDTIQKQGGEYTFNHIQVGSRKQDISSTTDDARLAPCPAPGQPPDNAIPVKLPSEVRIQGQWVDVANEGGEFYTVVDTQKRTAWLKHRDDLTPADQVVVSQTGIEPELSGHEPVPFHPAPVFLPCGRHAAFRRKAQDFDVPAHVL